MTSSNISDSLIAMTMTAPWFLGRSEAVVEVCPDHKAVQAFDVDPSKARLVTGGIDNVLKYWEFSGMNGEEPRPFREIIPSEGQPILALSYNANGSLVLCITSDARAKVFDREGSARAVEETIKGDQYIRMPENTKGHTHNLSYGEFHPRDNSRFLTSSYDSTVRLWDLNTPRIGMDQHIPNLNCFKCVDARNICGGSKMYVSTAKYSSDGSQIIAGCSDGSLHLFHEKNKYGKGLQIIRSAHLGAEITGIRFLFDEDRQLVTRGTDDCVKFWDLRKFKDPVRSWGNIETARSFSNISISPDNKWLIMGTGTGEIASIDLESGELGGRHRLPARQIIRTEWIPGMNQIFASSIDGNLFILYDPVESTGGALSFVNKKATRKEAVSEPVLTSAAVFSYDDLIESGKYRENKEGEIRPVIEKPQFRRPVSVGGSDVLNALEHRRRLTSQEDDIQQSLLRMSPEEDEGLLARAYKRTQPDKILDFSDSRSKVDDLLKQSKTYCPRCGLKICTCGFMEAVTKRQKL